MDGPDLAFDPFPTCAACRQPIGRDLGGRASAGAIDPTEVDVGGDLFGRCMRPECLVLNRVARTRAGWTSTAIMPAAVSA